MQGLRSPTASAHPLVVALHCSGGSSRQWRALAERLEGRATFFAPDLYGTAETGHWHGGHAFRLADEAAPLSATIGGWDGPVHLIGHSYGGALALHLASMRPARIASLILYEPTAFHLSLIHISEPTRPY